MKVQVGGLFVFRVPFLVSVGHYCAGCDVVLATIIEPGRLRVPSLSREMED
jgi:hypothetical protein